ncbi:nucleoside triphosphate pyrophosphohydrolase [Sulfurivermis fontis]|uniref:nucleoside triphosphate pyrophosphohydrolase n=1 Tax=Sulfurivermis fontis TaxID=1972068 RepID=UPI000FD82188|nr:nucleoside triphosphate pyrophosphohydrolase [Sulfurivermis fontis]
MSIDELIKVMATLRDPEQGCPWDREQTFATIAPYTLEEAYEVADAIARQDMAELREELGDLLFQVVFHAQMAREAGQFDFNDVVQAIVDKMVRRHPHVFADVPVADAAEQTARWEAQKAAERAARAERQAHSALDGVAVALPALVRAEKIQKRAARAGFDWPDIAGPLAKVREEVDEVAAELAAGAAQEVVAAEIGDLLFATVNLARHAGVDAETALREATRKFERRFRAVEAGLGKPLAEASLAEMDAQWAAVKRAE